MSQLDHETETKHKDKEKEKNKTKKPKKWQHNMTTTNEKKCKEKTPKKIWEAKRKRKKIHRKNS